MKVLGKVLVAVALVAAGLWVGGLLALGAIAAPVVFKIVPPPFNADAMTVVFRRFDRVAMSAAAVILIVEVALAVIRRPNTGRDAARAAAAVAAGALSVWQGAALSPRIEALHQAGAVRGQGTLGLDLEAAHSLAELCGKSITLLVVAVIVLHVFSVPRLSGDPFVEPSPKIK